MKKKCIHLIARQVGTAYPLIEFGRILAQKGYEVRFFSLGLAKSIFQKFDVPFTEIQNATDYQNQIAHLPDSIFTGTSEEKEADQLFWQWARDKGLVSYAWLDQAINFFDRFIDINNSQLMPDYLLTNDSSTFEDAQNYKPACKVVNCGSPYLTTLFDSIQRRTGDRKLAFFISEPTQPEYRPIHGFDQIDSFLGARHVLAQNIGDSSPIDFYVHLHPRDNADSFAQTYTDRTGENLDVKYSTFSKEEVLSKADFIFGMRSMLLYEAACLGITTVSLQPARKTTFRLIDVHPNILTVTDFQNPQRIDEFLAKKKTPYFERFDLEKFSRLFP